MGHKYETQVLIPQLLSEYSSEKINENRSVFARVVTKINVSHMSPRPIVVCNLLLSFSNLLFDGPDTGFR